MQKPSVKKTVYRICQVIARSGIASRREAEKLITQRRVHLNGQLVTSPALNVSKSDVIAVDAVPLSECAPTRVWQFYKKKGLIVSKNDERGRETLFSRLPSDLQNVMSIGRLDYNSEGLILLTNDGRLSEYLAHPSRKWIRVYRVRAYGTLDPRMIEQLELGVCVNGIHYAPIQASLDSTMGSNHWLTMRLREGKKREIRNILESYQLQVSRLIRVSFGPFCLGKMQPDELKEIPQKILKEQLGQDFSQIFSRFFH